jgi:hypothetical protein
MWKYKIGTVVREKDGSCNGMYTGADTRPMFGHVIGFDSNGFESILRVRWDDESERSIHPSNVFTEDEDVK